MKLFTKPATTLAEYGAFASLSRALAMKPNDVVNEISLSGLRGKGGAAFPTGKKMGFVAAASAGEKFVVCNASASEPGNCKDEWLAANHPFAVLEGLLIACRAVGARTGIIATKRSKEEIIAAMTNAASQLEKSGALPKGITLEIKAGPSHYLTGEETSLINFINGKPAIPSRRPPYPAQSGVHAMPTLVNNCETLANLPSILARGGVEYAKTGTLESKGTMLLCTAGMAEKKIVEVEFGTPLAAVAADAGIAGGCKACLMSPAGGFLPASLFNEPLSSEGYARHGVGLGSGGAIFFPEDCSIVRQALLLAKFFGKWSCRQCPACSEGMGGEAVATLERLCEGNGNPADVKKLHELCNATDGTICGLAPGAARMLSTALRHFPQEFNECAAGRQAQQGFLWAEGL